MMEKRDTHSKYEINPQNEEMNKHNSEKYKSFNN